MKTCPTCGNQYGDEMKFCQVDGTPLNAPPSQPEDPFKTVIGGRPEQTSNRADDFDPNKTVISGGNQTMSGMPFETGLDAPKDVAPPSPFGNPPPSSSASDYSTPSMNPPSFGDISGGGFQNPPNNYSAPQPPTPDYNRGQTRGFDEPRPTVHFGASPYENASPTAPEWNPPPAPNANWENQGINQNTPFTPPQFQNSSASNQTLAVVSLICGAAGILLICCHLGIPLGIAGLATGFIARKNIRENPQLYTGDGLALAGMITGGISVGLSILLIVLGVLGSLAGR